MRGHLELDGSNVTSNRTAGWIAESMGAGVWATTLTSNSSSISQNRIEPSEGLGGFGAGVFVTEFDIVSTDVSDNAISTGIVGLGAGVYANGPGSVDDSLIGRNTIDVSGFAGGGGLAVEDLEISDSALTENGVRSSYTEGLRTSGGAALFVGIEVVDSEFVGNTAEGRLAMGGALGTDYFTANENDLPREIVGSTFRGNVAESNSEDDYAFGGALAADGFTVQRSLFVENEARSVLGAFGGALTTSSDGELPPQPITVEDSTFVENAAVSDTTSAGGAISVSNAGVSVVRSTLSSNTADEGSAVGVPTTYTPSQGIEVAASSFDGAGPLCGADVSTGSHVVATDGSCAGASVVDDVGLDSLTDNGGPTDTMLPQPGSPLVDAIAAGDPACGDVDQRGVARPVGPACDIGAVETTDPLQVVGAWDAQLLAGDFDGDGVDDVFGYRSGPASDGIAWNGEPKTFQSQRVSGDYLSLVEDFDGDGDDDVFWYAAGSRPDYLWWSDGDRTFTSAPERVNGTYQPFVGDFDGNGAGDVFWYAPGSAPDYLWWGSADGFASRPTTVNGSYEPFVGDFDGDDATDITWYAPGGAADYVWWSGGDRTFHSVATTIGGTYEISTGDHDGDGSDDVFFHGRGDRPDYVWWGADDRAFTSVPRSVGGTYGLVPGDFDGDGADDLLLHGPGAVPDVVHMGGTRDDFLT